MSVSNASLLLCPDDPAWLNKNINHTIKALQKIEFIGVSAPDQTCCFFVGEKFLELVAFMGCAPNIRLQPEPDADNFTHIQLINNPDEILFQSGQYTRPPHCPTCQKSMQNWQRKNIHTGWVCEHCGQKSHPWSYNWRRSAGFAHFFIKVTDIYPKEALPQQELLAELEKSHGVGWQYFYV